MFNFMKHCWSASTKLLPLVYIHFLSMGYTFGFNNGDLTNVLGMLLTYIVYFTTIVGLMYIFSIVVHLAELIWRKL